MHVCMYECMYIIYPSTGRRPGSYVDDRRPHSSGIGDPLGFIVRVVIVRSGRAAGVRGNKTTCLIVEIK